MYFLVLPPDVLIDLLSVDKYRDCIMKYYNETEEPAAVQNAIKNAKDEITQLSLPEAIKK